MRWTSTWIVRLVFGLIAVDGFVTCPAAMAQQEHCLLAYDAQPNRCQLALIGRPADLGFTSLPDNCTLGLVVCDPSGAPADSPCLQATPGDLLHIHGTWNNMYGTCACADEVWIVNLLTRDRARLILATFGPCNPPGEETFTVDQYVPMPDLSHNYQVQAELIGPGKVVDVGQPIQLTLRLTNPAPWPVTVYMRPGSDDRSQEGLFLNDRSMEHWPASVGKSVRVLPSDRITVDAMSTSEFTIVCTVPWPGQMRFTAVALVGDYMAYFPYYPVPPLTILQYGVMTITTVKVGHEVQILNVEPVQAVYGADLVAKKPMLMRVTLENLTAETQTRRVLAAAPHPFGSDAQIYRSYQVDTIEIPPGKSEQLLPVSGWLMPRTSGRFTASIDDDVIDTWGPSEPTGKSPTTLKVQRQVYDIKPPRMEFTSISVADAAANINMPALSWGMLSGFMDDTVEYLNAVYPMPPITVNDVLKSYQTTTGDLDRIYEQLEKAAVQSGVERIVGILPNDQAVPFQSYYAKIGRGGQTGEANNTFGAAGRAVTVMPYDPVLLSATKPVVVAHELGHTYSLPGWCLSFTGSCEEYGAEGGSLEDGLPASPGVWVQGRDVLPDDELIQIGNGVNSAGQRVTNFMGRAGTFRVGTSIKKWATKESYQVLLKRFSARSNDPEILLVSGLLGSDGSVQMDPWYIFTTEHPSVPDAGGTHRVAFLDAGQHELASFGFTPSYWRYQDPAPATLDTARASVALAVPTVPGYAEVQIRQGANVLYTRHTTSNAPGVSITSPGTGDSMVGGSASSIQWTGADADGDPLSYTVLFSNDNGANWTVLALDIPASSLSWEVPDVDASCAQIKVRVSDGLRSAEAVSGCFHIQGTAAAPLMARPGPSRSTAPGVPVQLDGSASLNSQGLPVSFRWELDGAPAADDGTLENGTSVTPTFTSWTPGRYLLSLVIGDGEHTSAPAYITVTVSGANPANPNVVLSTGYAGAAASETPAPVPMGGFTEVSGGGGHTLALKSDGTVWSWGNNAYGQLGVGTNASSSTPVQVVGLTNVAAIAAAGNHSLAVKSDGTLWAWGWNAAGQLGDGTTGDRTRPVQVAGLTDVIAAAAGDSHSLALRSDRTVWGWGSNTTGQLGDGTWTNRSLPVQTAGLVGVSSIAAGTNHSLAVRSDQTVWSWGYNSAGQLGDGTTESHNTPVQVSGITGVASIAAGEAHSLALASDGTVWVWGNNNSGQLGDASWDNHTTAIHLTCLTGATAIAANRSQSLVLMLDGSVWGWGSSNGQYAPAPVDGLTDVVKIAAGMSHGLAIRSDGTTWSWGSNQYGQLGHGTKPSVGTAVQVPRLTGPVKVSAGGSSLVLRADGAVWAWGDNWAGQLGDGTTTSNSEPGRVSDLNSVMAVASGWSSSLALKSNGTVWGWGNNSYGQLGDGTATNRSTPVQLPGLANVTAISAGANHGMALASDRTVWTWGYNYSGQLGNGNTATTYQAAHVPDFTDVIDISAGGAHSLALKSDKTVWAWGANGDGRLGDGSTTNRLTPVKVSALTDVKTVAAGGSHCLALLSDGTVWAWGSNGTGQLGDGSTTNRSTPVQVAGLGGIIAISAGYEHSLALKADGTVWAWGGNRLGQLGDGTTTNRSTPVQAQGVRNATGVAAGLNHSVFLGMLNTPPAVVSAWPGSGTCESGASDVIVIFDRSMVNVTADDLVLSGGMVTGVYGSGSGPYVFSVTGMPQSPIDATLQGDISDLSGQPLPAYQWTFGNAGAPTFTQQPASQTVCTGLTVQFTASATGAGSYRWEKNGLDLNDGGHVSGAASATLTITGADATDVGSYRCIATGNCPATSDAAILAIVAPPVINTQPKDQTACTGTTARFSVEVAGIGTLRYRWYKDQNALIESDKFAGTTTDTLTITGCSLDDQGQYVVAIADACDAAVTSDGANLTVANGTAVVITEQPHDHVCTGGDVTFTVKATGFGTLVYQWYKDDSWLNDSDHLAGTNTATMLIRNCTVDDYGSYVVVVDDGCGGSLQANAVYLTDPTDCNHNGILDAGDIAGGNSQDCDGDGVPDECGFTAGLRPLDQWAASIVDFSTQYSDGDWSAQQATGQPNTSEYGDIGTAWAPGSDNGTQEFITLGYDQPVLAEGVTIRETFGNGMVSQIDLLDVEGQLHTVWSGIDPTLPDAPADFPVDWPRTSYQVKGVKISIDTDRTPSWEEIDAVQLRGVTSSFPDCNSNGVPDVCDMSIGTDPDCNGNGIPDTCDMAAGRVPDCNHNGVSDACDTAYGGNQLSPWTSNLLGFSSQRSATDGAAQQAVGAPDTPNYGDAPTSWSPAAQNGTHEFITLGLTLPLFTIGVNIRETAGNGMVYQIDLLDTKDQIHTIWKGTDSSQPGAPAEFRLTWVRTSFAIKAITIHVDTNRDPGWEEIDAVQVDGFPGPFDCNQNSVPDICDPDADADTIPDGCDLCSSTPPGVPVDVQGCPAVLPTCNSILGADLDSNCVVDFRDYSWFQWCLSGPGIPAHDYYYCGRVDYDQDGDVDQQDFGAFQGCFSGSNVAADPNCAR